MNVNYERHYINYIKFYVNIFFTSLVIIFLNVQLYIT